MSSKLIHDNIAGERINETDTNFENLLNDALRASGIKGRHNKAKFAKRLTKYAKDGPEKIDLQFSGKDIKRLLKPKYKRVYTKHSLEVVYFMVRYIIEIDNTKAALILSNNAEYIREIYNKVNFMFAILNNEEIIDNMDIVLPSLQWQENRVSYFVNSISKFLHN